MLRSAFFWHSFPQSVRWVSSFPSSPSSLCAPEISIRVSTWKIIHHPQSRVITFNSVMAGQWGLDTPSPDMAAILHSWSDSCKDGAWQQELSIFWHDTRNQPFFWYLLQWHRIYAFHLKIREWALGPIDVQSKEAYLGSAWWCWNVTGLVLGVLNKTSSKL